MTLVIALSLVLAEAVLGRLAPAGLYELNSRQLVGITTFADGRTVMTDFTNGWTARLTPAGEDRFVARRANGDSIVASFLRRGSLGPDLTLAETGRSTRRSSRLVFRREGVTFTNGDVQLSGTLVLPRGHGPHPVVIRLHGAGPSDRINAIEELYAHHGVAFFSYDKRGVGGSSGDWRTAGVDSLAGDAVAAFHALSRHPEIDSLRIGLGAGSEGGWLAAAVAERLPRLAFVFMLAGPALGFFDEVLAEIEAKLRQSGTGDEDVREALDFARLQMGLIASGDAETDLGWRMLQARADSVRREPWYRAVAPWPRDDWRWRKFHLMAEFDPAPMWSRYRRPLLAVYGGLDLNVPATPNITALQRAMREAANSDASIDLMVGADHEGLDPASRDGDVNRFVPGYLERPLRWVLDRVRRP